jgi:Flp pilus assembly protein TadG
MIERLCMRNLMQVVRQRALARAMIFGRRMARNEDGVTAIEFAMVGMPFFMMLFGIMGVGLYFFSVFNLENALEQASRKLRTGEAQAAGKTKTAAEQQADFKTSVCGLVAPFLDCDGKLRVQVVNVTTRATAAAAAVPPTPVQLPTVATCREKLTPTSDDTLIATARTSFDAVDKSETVVVTLCYQMDLLQSIPFIKLGNMPDGSMMLQAAIVFKAEPF